MNVVLLLKNILLLFKINNNMYKFFIIHPPIIHHPPIKHRLPTHCSLCHHHIQGHNKRNKNFHPK